MNKALLSLEVVGVDGMIMKADKISSINVRLENGRLLGVRPGHAPLIGAVVNNYLDYKCNEEWNRTKIKEGIVTIENNIVRVLTSGVS